jgi:hypothetical protein
MPAPETHLMCSPNWSARWTIQGLRDFEAPGEIERLTVRPLFSGFAGFEAQQGEKPAAK